MDDELAVVVPKRNDVDEVVIVSDVVAVALTGFNVEKSGCFAVGFIVLVTTGILTVAFTDGDGIGTQA